MISSPSDVQSLPKPTSLISRCDTQAAKIAEYFNLKNSSVADSFNLSFHLVTQLDLMSLDIVTLLR